jgi:hypothetical protein
MSRRAFLTGLAIIGLLVFSLYRAKYGARESADQIAAVEAQIDEAVQERSILLGELSHLSRQEWVEDFARNELGMVPVRADQFLRPEDIDRVLGPVSSDHASGATEIEEVSND